MRITNKLFEVIRWLNQLIGRYLGLSEGVGEGEDEDRGVVKQPSLKKLPVNESCILLTQLVFYFVHYSK